MFLRSSMVRRLKPLKITHVQIAIFCGILTHYVQTIFVPFLIGGTTLPTQIMSHLDDDEDDCSISRAIADLEMLSAAYPDEVNIPYDLPSFENDDQASKLSFPFTFTLTLPDPSTITNTGSPSTSNNKSASFITMDLPKGYPTKAALKIQSYRCGGGSTESSMTKYPMEQSVQAAQNAALECFENEEEAGFQVCQAAISTWEEFIQELYEKDQDELALAQLELQDKHEKVMLEEGEGITWISSTNLLIDRKSTFQAHITVVNSDDMVQRALRKLIGGSTKIQKATHNMYAYRFKQKVNDKQTIVVHDNDDDGESAAGSKLAHLLEMRDDDGVLVVVSRWFGGIHLGPKRFAHIVNVAREMLIEFESSGQLEAMKEKLNNTTK